MHELDALQNLLHVASAGGLRVLIAIIHDTLKQLATGYAAQENKRDSCHFGHTRNSHTHDHTHTIKLALFNPGRSESQANQPKQNLNEDPVVGEL